MDVRFTLERDGSLSNVMIVHDDIRDRGLKARIKSAMSSWRLPPPTDGPIRITTPIVFRRVTSRASP